MVTREPMLVAIWNEDRNNSNFEYQLELTMLNEEAQEFKDAMKDMINIRKGLYNAATEEEQQELVIGPLTDAIDAYCDFKFVLEGTQYKVLGNDYALTSSLISNALTTLDYMRGTLLNIGLSDELLHRAYIAVIHANTAKGTEKVDGKIQKGAAWVDPKVTIKSLIREEIY